MSEELETRLRSALRAEVGELPFVVTRQMVEERLSQSSGVSLLTPAMVMVGVVALIVVAVSLGVPEPRGLIGSDRSPTEQASDLQVWPDQPLPAPYDWEGVAQALRPRGLVLERPTIPEAAVASVDADTLVAAVEQYLVDDPRATMVGAHLAVVTSDDLSERGMQLSRELVYVVETTGHPTGNCIDLWSATNKENILAACFYPDRSNPPSRGDEGCAATRPEPPLAAPSPYPASPPDDRKAWFGSPELWAMLDLDGEIWDAGATSFPVLVKTFWWSSNWPGMRVEQQPDITVTATRLDGAGRVTTDDATNAAADSLGGEAMLVGIAFPSAGCWELAAEYRGAVLSYIVSIRATESDE